MPLAAPEIRCWAPSIFAGRVKALAAAYSLVTRGIPSMDVQRSAQRGDALITSIGIFS
jgi:hypothetical protein